MILRKAVLEDYEDVLEICEKIWDGGDYIPNVFKKWVNKPELGECLVIEMEGKVVGITRTTFLSDEVAWFEGIRVHQDYRGKKIGKALADEQFKRAYDMGFSEIQLSSYIDNTESLAMIEKRGFKRIGEWVFLFLEDLSQLDSDPSIVLIEDEVEALSLMEVTKLTNSIYPIDFVFTDISGVKRHWWDEIRVEKIVHKGSFIGRIAWMRDIKYFDQLNIIAIDPIEKDLIPWVIGALNEKTSDGSYHWMALQYPRFDRVYEGLLESGFKSEHDDVMNTFHYQYKQRR